MVKQLKYVTVTGTVAVCIFCLLGCIPIAGRWEYQEVKRIKSPDDQVEAIILTGDAGATTSKATFILLAKKGANINMKNPEEYSTVFAPTI